jgi:hypothetical protein
VTDWQVPAGGWGQTYDHRPPPLPWYRTTPFLILFGLGMLVIGAVGGIIVLFIGLGAGYMAGAFTPDVTTYGAGGDLAAFAIGGGQCATVSLDAVGARGYAEGSGVPCDGGHAFEHYASVEAPTLDQDGGRFPRTDLATFADSACTLAFEPYVGRGSDSSDYDYRPIVPAEAAWNDGVRTVHCVLFAPDGEPDVGSAHRSGR